MRRQLNARYLVGTLAVLPVAATAIHFAHSYQVSRTSGSFLAFADKAAQAGEFAQAVKYYRQYLEREPDDGKARAMLALLLDTRASTPSDWAEVVELCKQVLTQEPAKREVRQHLVSSLIQLRRFREAIAQIDLLLPDANNKAELEHMLGWCWEAIGSYERAATSFKKAIALDAKRIDTYVLLAEVLQRRLNRAEEAAQVMDRLVEANREDFRSYLARYEFRRGQNDKDADADLDRALDLAPREPAVLAVAAARAETKGDLDAARGFLRTCLDMEPKNVVFAKAMAILEARTGHMSDAVVILEAASKHSPDNWDLLGLRAQLLIDEGKLAEAATALEQLKESDAPAAVAEFVQARLLAAQGQWQAALKLLEKAGAPLTASPAWAESAYTLVGQCQEHLGDLPKAVAAYEQAFEAGDRQTDDVARLVRLLLYLKRSIDAERILHRIEGSLAPELMRQAAEVALVNQSPEEALALARQWFDAARRDYRDCLWLGRIAHDAGDKDEAERAFHQALALAPQTPETWVALVEELTRNGKRAQARRLTASAAAAVGPALASFTEARCLAAMGLVAEAESRYSAAIAERPQDFVLLESAAQFFLAVEDAESAGRVLEALINLGATVPEERLREARRLLALVRADQGDRARATALISTNLVGRPKSPADLRVQALNSATDSAGRRQAVRVFEETSKRLPLTPEETYRLANLLDAEGDLVRAREAFTQLVAAQPENPRFLASYIRHLLKTEEVEQAQKEFQRLESLEPESRRVLELRNAVGAAL